MDMQCPVYDESEFDYTAFLDLFLEDPKPSTSTLWTKEENDLLLKLGHRNYFIKHGHRYKRTRAACCKQLSELRKRMGVKPSRRPWTFEEDAELMFWGVEKYDTHRSKRACKRRYGELCAMLTKRDE